MRNGYVNGQAGAGADTPAPVSTMQSTVTRVNGNGNPGLQPFVFRKAIKYDAKLRLAISGPGGSGKTYTLLKLATELGGKIAFLDTEHGSASKYADEFEFDVLELDSFDPGVLPELIASVAAQGYASLITDSWSHFWMGEGGELDQVDSIAARSQSRNSFAAWRQVSPKHNRMIDAMLSAPIHILVSMRVKTEWVVEKDEKGKTVPRKVGLAPVMRDGVEYEFDVCGDMDQDNTLVVTKSRCPKLSGKVVQKPGREMALILRDWLGSPQQRPARPSDTALRIDTGGHPEGTSAAAQAVADRKVASGDPTTARPWTTFGEMKRIYLMLREQVGEVDYLRELARYGWKSVADIRSVPDAIVCYHNLQFLAERAEAERTGDMKGGQ